MAAAAISFSGLDSSAKWLGRTMDPLETAAIRYLGSFIITLLFP